MKILNNFEKSKLFSALFAAFMVAFFVSPGSDNANSQQQVIQKIEALVNDDVITAFDVGQRMGLVLLGTGRTLNSQEELLQLRAQVLETLINEKLEIQEALQYEVPVPEDELFEVYGRVARSYNRTEETFEELLQSYGTSTAAILAQIEAEYAWQTLVNGRYSSYVEAKDEEIEAILAEMEANAGKREYRLSEIFLISSDPTQDERVQQTAARIKEQMGDAFRFGEMARQFSQSTTSAQGGDLGWISEAQLAPEIFAAVQEMDILDVSEPIKTSGGYYLIAMTDRRSILQPEPLDENFSVRQVGWFFTQETTEESAGAWYDMAEAKAEAFTSCENLDQFVRELGDGIVARDLGTIPLKQFNPELREILMEFSSGTATPPINTPDGFIIFVICDRSMPEAILPTPSAVQQQLETQRIAMMARRYLRDLKRDAIIDYK